MEEHLLQGMRGIGAGRPSATFRIDHAVDQGDEQFGEHGRRDVDAKHAFLLSAQEEGVQRFQVGLPACAFAVRVEEVRAVLEYQEYQQLAVGEVFLDQALQRLQRLGMLQVAGLDDLVQYGLSVVLEHLHQVVPRAAEAVQGGLAYAGRLGQFLQRRSRAVDDSDCQRLMSRSSWEIRVIDGSRLVFLIVRIVQKTGLASKGISCQKII